MSFRRQQWPLIEYFIGRGPNGLMVIQSQLITGAEHNATLAGVTVPIRVDVDGSVAAFFDNVPTAYARRVFLSPTLTLEMLRNVRGHKHGYTTLGGETSEAPRFLLRICDSDLCEGSEAWLEIGRVPEYTGEYELPGWSNVW